MKKKTRKQIGIENFGKRFNQKPISIDWNNMMRNVLSNLSDDLEEFDTNQKVIPFNVKRNWPESIIAFNKPYALTYSGYQKDEAEHYIWPWLHDFIMLMYHIETIYDDGTIIIDGREDKDNILTTEKIDDLVNKICGVIQNGVSIRAFRDSIIEKCGLKKVIELN